MWGGRWRENRLRAVFHLEHDNDVPPRDLPQLREAILGTLRNELTLDPKHRAVLADENGLRVTLTGARVSTDVPPARPKPRGEPQAGPTFPVLNVEGVPVYLDSAAVSIRMHATDARFQYDRDVDTDQWLLMLHDAEDGTVDVAVPHDDLKQLIEQKVRQGAAEHGVDIRSVTLDVAEHGARGLKLDGRIAGTKSMGFLKPSFAVRLHGKLDVDDELVARLSDLHLDGEGVVMKMLVGMLGDKLKQLEQKRFPLAAFPLGEAKLRDVRIAASDPLRITASFGR